jgi:energy-coupling factor transporter ATP-binding protein EcfA2
MRLEGLTSISPNLLKRLERFQCLTVAHPLLLAARDQLMDVIDGSLPGSLILVLGPTGVGKTTLRCKLEQSLLEQMTAVLVADPGRLPFVSVEATVPEASRFRWRDYFAQFLASAREPLIERKVLLDQDHMSFNAAITGSQLQHSAVQLLRYRRRAAVFIDEAQHLSRVASGRRLIDQLDVIKSMANRTQTTHVLLGTYELLAFHNLSGQLSRRSVDLHFPRYRAESDEDIQIFKNVLVTFQNQFPTSEPPRLLQQWEFLYERSVGCVGVLKDWLMRAAICALKSAANTVNLEHLEKTALSISQCAKILAEARDGESRLTENEETRLQFRKTLGLHPKTAPCETSPAPTAHKLSKPTKRKRVGQRRPTRDPVGRKAVAHG